MSLNPINFIDSELFFAKVSFVKLNFITYEWCFSILVNAIKFTIRSIANQEITWLHCVSNHCSTPRLNISFTVLK